MSQRDNDLKALYARLQYLEQQHQATAQELFEIKQQLQAFVGAEEEKKPMHKVVAEAVPTPAKGKRSALDWESFVGENLINKIGIIITIIGVAVGAKYSIDNNLLGPVGRVLVGYGLAAALLAVGFKLKKGYNQYSAALVSGAMTIFYLITYAAYTLYALFPQELAFGLMVLFTLITVLLALWYNQQIIALLGLIGAYAVPFLLSDGSGKVYILLSYLAIINTGISVLAFKKYWKPLLNFSFVLTWSIVGGWLLLDFNAVQHLNLAVFFLPLFFILFYASFLGYKALNRKVFTGGDVFLLMSNGFVFYGLSVFVFNQVDLEAYLGVFTFCNGLWHAGIGYVLYRARLFDKRLLLFLIGLGISFVSISIPVSLDASWVTLLWAFEAILLLYIGRSRGEKGYERLAYPLVVLTLISLMQDWYEAYGFFFIERISLGPVAFQNIYFLSGLLVSLAFGGMAYCMHKWPQPVWKDSVVKELMQAFIPLAFVGVLYFTFFLEINLRWEHYYDQVISLRQESLFYKQVDLVKQLWLVHYTLAFLAVVSLFKFRFNKGGRLTTLLVWINLLALFLCARFAFPALTDLATSYQEGLAYFGWFNVGIRYLFLGLAALLMAVTSALVRQASFTRAFKTFVNLGLHGYLLLCLSGELVHWLEMAGTQYTFKLSLSILWGVYALWLIVLGIWKRTGYLRVGAIVLFALTLLKLFVYDLSSYNALSKTVVFVSLGLLLLIISFLYNKYKALILSGEVSPSTEKAEAEDR